MTTHGVSRRHALQGAAIVGVGLPVLAACGNDDSGEAADPATDTGNGTNGETDEASSVIRCGCHGSRFSVEDGSVLGGPATAALAEKSVTVNGDDVEVDGEVVGSAADVPEGGGAVFPDAEVVVTQPEAGSYKAFTAVCTHQGCIVAGVEPA
ncbi:hypothetical protein ACFP3Q_03055 [Nocardioides sp. GCM10027113]|uniref:hypothetical protein n=1 Tax=unclassified Nocardioides TaxID=2615069 RepID=UPI00360C2649